MVNDHFVLWPSSFPHILSFMAESIIRLAWIQFWHLHLGALIQGVGSPDPLFSLNSRVLFLILLPYCTFGNPACQASLDTTCLTSLLVQKTSPLVASSHIQSYTITIINLIWNYILFYQRPQSHIWQCNKQQFCKTGEMQITWFSVLVKSQVRLKSFHQIQSSISQVI